MGNYLIADMMALAMLAGNAVVAASTTDAWEAVRREFARLLGRGEPDRTAVAERRLAEIREQLASATGADLEHAHAALAERWAGPLEEYPMRRPS